MGHVIPLTSYITHTWYKDGIYALSYYTQLGLYDRHHQYVPCNGAHLEDMFHIVQRDQLIQSFNWISICGFTASLSTGLKPSIMQEHV